MNCLVCEETITLDGDLPWHAVAVNIPGNYGSAVHDPAAGEPTLRAYLCDLCLLAKGRNGGILAVTVTRTAPQFHVQTWTPEPTAHDGAKRR